MEDKNQSVNVGTKHSSGVAIESPRAPERRALKFRAWDKDSQRMLLDVTFGDSRMPSNWAKWFDVMQFTGILDKNGVEIYESDILKHHKYGGTHVVEWLWESTGFFVGENMWPLTTLCVPSIEVVGNVYETVNVPAPTGTTTQGVIAGSGKPKS